MFILPTLTPLAAKDLLTLALPAEGMSHCSQTCILAKLGSGNKPECVVCSL